ncbi:MAG: carboxypeptidase regulatory-like domain-containing protein [bacterium]|nr:carboxypeptidase regulatory-like domain-containing protein [bacterium]
MRITIQLGEKHIFRVVDKALGTPLEDCSILIMPRAANGQRTVWENHVLRHAVEHYPDGELRIRAAGGKDAVEVEAEGYQTLRVNVAVLEKGPQILRLEAGWTATGRVVLNGQAVEGARVDLVARGSAAKQIYTDAEGRFEVTGLAAPSYELLASQSGAISEPHLLAKEKPGAGDLPLLAMGEVRGTLLIPDFIEPGEISLNMGRFRQIRIDGEGRFHLKDIPAGKYKFGVRSIDGKLDGHRWSFAKVKPSAELSPGQVADVTLDLNELAVGSIRLRLLAGGLPVVGFSVRLGRVKSPGSSGGGAPRVNRGKQTAMAGRSGHSPREPISSPDLAESWNSTAGPSIAWRVKGPRL